MLRIGIMLDSCTSTAWVAKIIQDIQSSDFADVSLVILNTPVPEVKLRFTQRVKDAWKYSLYFRYETWDYRRHRQEPDAKKELDVTELLRKVPSLTVAPLRKGFTDRFREEDLAQIRAANLDVIFRFGFRIIRGDILKSAKYGVWSYHHGDNREYRGGPALFWEVYEGNPVSGTILQVLTDSLDGGHVIYRGHSSTHMTSLYLNRNAIYWKTAEFAMRRLRDLHYRGWDYIQSLPTYIETDAYSRKINRAPNARQTVAFLGKLFVRKLKSKALSFLQGDREQWFVAIRRRLPERSFASASGYQILRPPKDRFYADPFLLKKNDKTYLIMEDYRFREERAVISCSELGPDGTPGDPIEILRRPYHLSYPFVFEMDGEIYMIPETKGNRTIELYRAIEFPARWSLETILMQDIFAVDATIHRMDGKFWMFVGISNGRYTNCDELALFYADSLFGPWTPHRNNPVVSDVRRSRPAGALFYADGKLIRPSQDCARAYGHSVCFSEVTVLNEMEYSERPIEWIEPGWSKNNLGTHTYSRSEDFEVIDGKVAARVASRASQPHSSN
ncbi:MAG TPA: hypothetical protein VE195_00900 [Acidobacteriaceae bacterium]|nr:hypothetical protein [Acidobacteriaceae bacterium]